MHTYENSNPGNRDMDIESQEKLITELASMDRAGLAAFLRTLECTFPLDFTEEFLRTVAIDRLRHIALAACLHRPRQSA